MKKGLLSVSIITILGLSGCFGDLDTSDVNLDESEDEVEQPYLRVVFDPANGDINVPNDLLMIPSGDFFDFTLNTEGTDTFDPANPEHALSALDGWSANHPMAIRFNLEDGIDIDPTTVGADSIRLFEATQALEGDSTECLTITSVIAAPGIPCELGDELEYGVDFVASYTEGSGTIAVVPLTVLKPAQGHLLVVTDSLLDSEGRGVQGSYTWEVVRQDIETNILGIEALLPVQRIVNYMVDVLEPVGIEREALSYAAYFSTQSVGTVLDTVKQLNIVPYATAYQTALASGADAATAAAVAAQYLPAINTALADDIDNAFEALSSFLLSEDELAGLSAVGLDTCDGLISAISDTSSPLYETAVTTFASVGAFCAATIVDGEVDLPYYSSTTEPLSQWWTAACTSGATLQTLGEEVIAGLVTAGAVGSNNDLCQLGSGGQLYDLDLSSLGMDDPRNLTKYNPIPVAQGSQADDPDTLYSEAGTENMSVLFTVPDEDTIAILSAATGGVIPVITKPESGWPVVVFQHGITTSKDNVLAVSSALSLAGYATASIDHPLHGDRGLVLADGTVVSASVNGANDFLNFESMLTGRDNSRQSIADIVAFRLALNAIADTTGLVDLDLSEVHFSGQSLGAIFGTGAVAIANTSLGDELAAFDGMYAFESASLNVITGGFGTFLLESENFGSSLKGALLAAASDEFVAFLVEYATANGVSTDEILGEAYDVFEQSVTEDELSALNSTFAAFSLAAQTVLDSADPVNYAQTLAANTPVLMQLVVGGGTNDDGSTALTDQVNPVETSLPLAGGQALADIMALPIVSQTAAGSGVVRFIIGDHPSLLSPSASVAATTEMQSQLASFVATQGQTIVVSNTDAVEN